MATVAGFCFRWSLKNQLVYPSCWEDPRVDRDALRISSNDKVVTITSGGCNALEYLLDDPEHVFAVDVNFRQNALLDLRLAGIRRLEFDDFFDFFGRGYSAKADDIYHKTLRGDLGDGARHYWDQRIRDFTNPDRPFYLRGGIGTGAWMFRMYVDHVARLRPHLDRLFAATTCEEQVHIYRSELRERFWTRLVRWSFNRPSLLAFAGIPAGQIALARNHISDVGEHMDHRAVEVLSRFPLKDNYFWQVFIHGEFTHDCCPEYLKLANFTRLKAGLIDRISTHTSTLSDFLRKSGGGITKFVLLDHFDWYYGSDPAQLSDAWQSILTAAAPGARLLWRSMGNSAEFMHNARVVHDSGARELRELLAYDDDLAKKLQRRERVNAYSGLFIADLRGN